MMHALFGLISLFPISFMIYVISERINATHESRVGKGITFSQFFSQSWTDLVFDLKQIQRNGFWLSLILQCALVFFLELDSEFVFLIYLALNFLLLAVCSPFGDQVQVRIEDDRRYMRFLIGSVIAFLSAFGVFSSSGSMSLSQVVWSPLFLFYIPLFQIAGMIMFGEHPFDGVAREYRWSGSIRFYVWCMLSVKLFLGGNLFFLDGHLKAVFLFLFCRIAGRYFPRYMQKDLFRVSVIYLIPLTGVLWLVTMLVLGAMRSGGPNV